MSKKLKIAIYSGDIPSTVFIERLIAGLSKKHCEIYLFGFIKNKVDYNTSISVFAYKNTKFQKAIYFIKYSFLLLLFKNKEKNSLDKILKKQSKNILLDKVKFYPVLWHQPDIFHIQWAKGLKDWVWVKEFGIKLVLSLRGAHINYSPIADLELADDYRENFPKVDAFHAVSKAIAKEAEKYNASKNKIQVIYSGLSLNEKLNISIKEQKVFNIISIGRAHWIKGYTYAIDASKILKDQGLKFEYTIVGATNNIEFAYQIHDLKLTDEVNLLDKLTYDSVQQLILNADLLLLPSVEEGIANVVLEAMHNKTLVLTTNCGGLSEVIKDGDNGFIVPIRDSSAMAKKILEIAELTDSKKESIIENAFQTIKANHREQQMVDNMLALYKSI